MRLLRLRLAFCRYIEVALASAAVAVIPMMIFVDSFMRHGFDSKIACKACTMHRAVSPLLEGNEIMNVLSSWRYTYFRAFFW